MTRGQTSGLPLIIEYIDMHILPLNRGLLLAASLPLTTCVSTNTPAETIYKSVDKDGKITYSSSPTESHQEAVKLNIRPPPSEEDVKTAHDRHQQNLRTDKILDETRQKRSQEIAEKNRINREKKEQSKTYQKPDESKQEGPYYGIPGHGILVLPGGSKIRR